MNSVTTTKHTGWGYPSLYSHNGRAHYMLENGFSLCGRDISASFPQYVSPGKPDSEHNCKACARKLAIASANHD